MSRIGVGIVGAGKAGSNFARAIQGLGEGVGIVGFCTAHSSSFPFPTDSRQSEFFQMMLEEYSIGFVAHATPSPPAASAKRAP